MDYTVEEQYDRITEYLKLQPTANVWEIFAVCTGNTFAVAWNELRRSGELAALRGRDENATITAWHTLGAVVEGSFGGIIQSPASEGVVARIGGKLYTVPRNLRDELEDVTVGSIVRIEYLGSREGRKQFDVKVSR
jgi:hypothetical protein